MKDVSNHLPSTIKVDGGKLFMQQNGPIIKYVLTNPKKKYRTFTYVRDTQEKKEGSLSSLWNTYYYDNNIGKIRAQNENYLI